MDYIVTAIFAILEEIKNEPFAQRIDNYACLYIPEILICAKLNSVIFIVLLIVIVLSIFICIARTCKTAVSETKNILWYNSGSAVPVNILREPLLETNP